MKQGYPWIPLLIVSTIVLGLVMWTMSSDTTSNATQSYCDNTGC